MISRKVRNDTRTSEIYKMVLEALKIEDHTSVIHHKYRLKEAIMKMGPAGYGFENYVGEILQEHGHKILSTRTIEHGTCVKHEIDLITEVVSTGEKYIIECKYHNMPGIYTGLKESLYTHARFLDLDDKYDREMLVCNTKLSVDAITYAKCIGQQVISWRYPPNNGLENMIEGNGLYPITILGLNRYELESLSRNNMMLIKDLVKSDLNITSNKTGISRQRLQRLQNLAVQILE